MAKALDKPSLYDTDYVAWLSEQAAHLRAGRLRALDLDQRSNDGARAWRSNVLGSGACCGTARP